MIDLALVPKRRQHDRMQEGPVAGFKQAGPGISVESFLDKQTLVQHLMERLYRDLADGETFR